MDERGTYYASFADKPLYVTEFTEEEYRSNDETLSKVSESARNVMSSFIPKTRPVKLIVAQENSKVTQDSITEYLKSCLTMVKIMRSVNNCEVVLGGHSDPKHVGFLKRCLFFTNEDGAKSDVIDILGNMKIPGDVVLYQLTQSENNDVFEKTKVHNGNTDEVTKYTIIRPLDTVSDHHLVPPMFRSTDFSPVYHSFERTVDILQKVSDIKEVKELLEIRSKELPESFDIEQLKQQMNYDFVVVEGMDAAGKTTLTEGLEKKLKAVRYYTPPPCIQHLRKFFDSLPEIVRRAYYSLGNYIVAVQIAKECQNNPVIMDRYWHSTAAYGIANETSLSDLLPENHVTYNWPSDLLRPTCVLFLTVAEEVRKQRMDQREGDMTREELSLDRDSLFRERLCQAYKRMKNPRCVEIDASGTKEEVAEMAEAVLLEHGVSLTSPTK